MFSRYVPGLTRTVSPFADASIAAWMEGKSAGTRLIVWAWLSEAVSRMAAKIHFHKDDVAIGFQFAATV